MCGRFNNHLPKMHGWVDALQQWPDFVPSYNVAPSTSIAAFKTRRGHLMRWGMVPPWADSFDSKFATFNARIETVEQKPAFKNAWNRAQRCIIPMAGYYEWAGEKGSKKPFYITDRNEACLGLVGLYEAWSDKQLSCTILTTAANKELASIHHRMPIMITAEQVGDWIYGDNNKDSVLQLDQPDIVFYPVSKQVGNVRNNSADLIEPIDLVDLEKQEK